MKRDDTIPAPVTDILLADHEIDLLEEGGMQILSALMIHPSTVRQLAIQLGLSRTRVKFIIDKLHQRRMVSVYRETQEGGRLETFYTATAENVSFQFNTQASPDVRMRGAHLILHSLQSNALKALNDPELGQVVAMKLAQCQMSSAQVSTFIAKLELLISEFSQAEDKSVHDVFALGVMLYPILTQQGT